MNKSERKEKKRKEKKDNNDVEDENILCKSESSMSKRKKKIEEKMGELESANTHFCRCPDEMTSGNSASVKEKNFLDKILTKKVPWDGYSPLHCIVNGRRPNVLARLLDMGYVRRKGMWMPEEIEQLNQNMEEFVRDHDVKDFKSFICNQTNDDKLFRKKTQFILKVSKGISRTGVEINKRLFSQFFTFVKKGCYSKEEMEEFKRLHEIYGNSWKEIGLNLNRRHDSLSYMYLNKVSRNWNKGPFTFEEKKALVISVIRFFENNEPISWESVSKNVRTRSSTNCRSYWVRHFSQIRNWEAYNKWLSNSEEKEDTIEEISFSNNDTLRLVNLISDANIDDEYLIDWNDLVKHFDHATSPAWLKWKFQAVCKEVPHSHRLDFEDLLEQLIEIYNKKVEEVEAEEVQALD